MLAGGLLLVIGWTRASASLGVRFDQRLFMQGTSLLITILIGWSCNTSTRIALIWTTQVLI